MKLERLGSPREFAQRVAEHLDLPIDDMAALVDAAFFASLHEEEARHTELDIAWQPGQHDCATLVSITPVQATPKNLAKLAPATRRDTSAIAVRREGDQLVAWGLLEHRADHPPLTVRVLGTGVLRVDLGGEARALYARGEIYIATSVKSPSKILAGTFESWDIERAIIVTQLAARVLEHGHGGMLLIVPADIVAPIGVRMHYAIGTGADVLVKGNIELVARLTAVDNAVMIDTNLMVRGFGVQVLEGDAPAMSFEHSDPYSDEKHTDDLSTFKGTRHPAGVVFCMRQPCEAAAIIASQDSQLSLAIKTDRGVEVVGSYERAFGWR